MFWLVAPLHGTLLGDLLAEAVADRFAFLAGVGEDEGSGIGGHEGDSAGAAGGGEPGGAIAIGEVIFLQGRIRFVGAPSTALFLSEVVVFEQPVRSLPAPGPL